MRVVAGELGGRRLVAPEGRTTRPTSDKVREAVFNALGSAGVLEGARVVDLYAGSGAMGIEALSRGAASCVFVEQDRAALAALRRNVDQLGLAERCRIVADDAVRFVHRPDAPEARDATLVLADPPYRFEQWDELVTALTASVAVAESNREVPAPPGWEVVRARRYGRTFVTILQRIA